MKTRSTKFIAIFLMIFMVVLVGCSKKEALSEQKPEKINQNFLMFKSTHNNEYGASVGDLYLKQVGKAAEKISSNVSEGEYEYINSQNKVLFLNDESELFEYVVGKEKVKLAKEVSTFNGNFSNDIVAFQNIENDLYLIQGEGEEEKISSSVSQYDIVGDYVYFIDNDGDFVMYNIKENVETEIANDIIYFKNLNNDDEVAYVDEDNSLFFKSIGDEESIKISSEEVSTSSIKKVGKNLVYLNIENNDSQELFETPISENGASVKIASDVLKYKYSEGYYYYINNDNNLYKKQPSDENSTKLAADVEDFSVKNGVITYIDMDNNLFSFKDGEKPKKIASSVLEYDVTPTGDIVYSTDDLNLFVNKTKVASDIIGFNHYFGNVAFSTKNSKLYLMENMGEKKLIEEDLEQFSNAFYHNEVIYENFMLFDDISGLWKSEDGTYFIEIDKDGVITHILSDYKEKLAIDYANYQSLEASGDSSYNFKINENNSLEISLDGEPNTFIQSSLEEANQYKKQIQVDADKEIISNLVDEYLYYLPNAVNEMNSDYISAYFDTNSTAFKETVTYLSDNWSNISSYYVEDYEIDSINESGEGVYLVNTTENHLVVEFGFDEDFETRSTFKNTYTLKRFEDTFLIIDLKTSKNSTDAL